MSRLPPAAPGMLNEHQRAVYDAIVGGPRAAGGQASALANPDGSLVGPFNAMVLAPAVGRALSALGEAVRYGTSLSAREREIAILTVAATRTSSFEWWAHERIARGIGLSEEEIDGIRRAAPTLSDAREAEVASFVMAALRHEPIVESAYRHAADVLGTETLIELVVLVGYYEALATLLTVFDVNAPDRPPSGD